MDKNKKYISPRCIDFSLVTLAYAGGECVTGSAPAGKKVCTLGSSPNNACWNGSIPQGGSGECASGGTPYQ